jgi:hypothetical protein
VKARNAPQQLTTPAWQDYRPPEARTSFANAKARMMCIALANKKIYLLRS